MVSLKLNILLVTKAIIAPTIATMNSLFASENNTLSDVCSSTEFLQREESTDDFTEPPNVRPISLLS
jgi:hypothetical protein